MSDAFYGFTAKGLEQETKKFVANPEEEQKRKKEFIEGTKSIATGVVTGTLGLPSDMLDLATMAAEFAAKFGDESVDSAYDYASMAKVMLPQIQNLQKKYGRQAFDEAFTAYTGVKSDASNPNQIIGELVGLGTVAKFGGKALQKSADVATPYIEKGIDAVKNIFKDPPDTGLKPELAGVGKVDDINTQTDKLLDVKKDITTTNIPNNIPAEEMFNAPKINPTMAGGNTPTGKIQQEKFLQLEEQGGKTPEQLFEETGVYRGEDGKLRWEIDDRDAELLDVDLSVGKKYNLSNLLKFDDLYKEYYKTLNVDGVDYQALKNVEVEFVSKKDDYLASYNHDRDLIQINLNDIDKSLSSKEAKKEVIISSLLHEVQHAVQRREGFTYGTSIGRELRNSPNYKEYKKAVEFLKDVNTTRKNFVDDNITPHLKQGTNQEKAITYFDNLMNSNNVDGMYYDLERLTTLSGKEIEKFQKVAQEKVNKEIISRALVNQEESLATKAYVDKYGEREARLVQARFEKRLKYKKYMNNPNLVYEYGFSVKPEMELFSKGKLKDTSFLLGKNPKTAKEKELKQMGGFDKTTQKSDIQTKHNNIIQTSENLEKIPVKKNLALQKISEQFDKSELDANGIPKNILKDKDGKPLILYYGDSGYTYVPPKLGEKDTLSRKTAYVDKGLPGKLIDKFAGAKRIGKGNFTTTNPFLASTYASASNRGSVIPVYIMAEKVIDAKKIGVDGIRAFDAAADKLGKNEVIVGNFGFDANAVGRDNLLKTLGKENYIKQMQEAGKKYTDTQYAFTGDTQVFSAISGEKLSKYNKGGIAKQMSNLGV